ncbi:ribbon-helix-helix domain-containing protein [Sulfurihydrogenibium subterraneum]|uniref:ribbon-helix-helix domain-containing protein n=1 Tax=Sulfurihydrogenibium subterraneum TaxID=171121 RepID=UPI00048CC9AE|nr:ribbon-helix-helix domain-containing protein [Sulfurihydrogenibium subterraneum]
MAVVKKTINIEENLAIELETLSKILGTSQSEIIEKALDFYLDYIDGIIAERVSKEIKEGKIKVNEADKVFKKFFNF